MERQGPKIKGKINLTCDGWQASNVDAYLAVTGHWVEEVKPGAWELKSALFGFTRMNSAHNGKQLGQALFKIVERLDVSPQVWLILFALH